jgi:hypothetical protein
MPEFISELPPGFMREFEAHVQGQIPTEKVQAELRQVRNARVMQAVGSAKVEGLGQLKAEIDPRLYFRLQDSFGHHEGWLDDLLFDNEVLRAPGWKPKKRKHDLRHSKTFIGGRPI